MTHAASAEALPAEALPAKALDRAIRVVFWICSGVRRRAASVPAPIGAPSGSPIGAGRLASTKLPHRACGDPFLLTVCACPETRQSP